MDKLDVNDIDGDGIINALDKDIDGDGVRNTSDEDIDGDGIKNVDDNDIDGDGVKNEKDDDIDGDGVENINDNDIDGDGVRNIDDNDIDGDGVKNEDDDDIDGDGVKNSSDEDLDNDGIANEEDADIDGDGIVNEEDPDIDNDGTVNEDDDTPGGTGTDTGGTEGKTNTGADTDTGTTNTGTDTGESDKNSGDTNKGGDVDEGRTDDDVQEGGEGIVVAAADTFDFGFTMKDIPASRVSVGEEIDLEEVRDVVAENDIDLETMGITGFGATATDKGGFIDANRDVRCVLSIYYVDEEDNLVKIITTPPEGSLTPVVTVGDMEEGLSAHREIFKTVNFPKFTEAVKDESLAEMEVVGEIKFLDDIKSEKGEMTVRFAVEMRGKKKV